MSAHGGVSVDSEYGISAYANQLAGVSPSDCTWDTTRWSHALPAMILDFKRNDRYNYSRFTTTPEYFPNWNVGDVAWITYTTPQLTVGTVITAQYLWAGANPAMPWTLTLGGGGSECTISGGKTGGAAIHGKATIEVNTLDRVGSFKDLRLEIAAVQNGSTGIADFSGIMVLPDQLEQITGVTPSANAPNLTRNDTVTYWVTNSPATLVFTFDDPGQRVDSIIFWSVDNGPAEFTIRVGEGSDAIHLADISMGNDPGGWVLPLKFDTPVYTDKIYLDFKQSAYNGLHEIVFLTKVPEPATMSLLALGGLAMLRRARRT
jgi:hypothetical protein